jgi:hypothetical protein
MKTRSSRPAQVSTRTSGHFIRVRKSIDDDYAPSITPSTADYNFPPLYRYHPPRDPTWRPSHHSPASPEPEDPPFKLHKHRLARDPTYRYRRSTQESGELDLAALARDFDMKTRSAANLGPSSPGIRRKQNHTI